jgi:hypothetical protein
VSVRGISAAEVDGELLDAYAELGVDYLGVILPIRDRAVAIAELERLAVRVHDHLAG